MRLLAPYATVTLGDRSWRWGDGFLMSVSVTLGEGENTSSCQATIYDPDRKFIDALLAFIQEVEGLEPLETPETPSPTTQAATGSVNPNVRAALDLIALGEVGANPAGGSNGYNIQFGGGTFASYESHPNADELTPAGRYQFQRRTWDEVAAEEGLSDFTPQSQDAAAIARFRFRQVLDDIEAGDIQTALEGRGEVNGVFTGLSYEWAAMPPSRYGQSKLTLSEAVDYFNERVAYYEGSGEERDAATESTAIAPTTENTRAETLAGSQMTIGFGFNGDVVVEFPFLHTSVDFSLYDTSIVSIGGQAAAWVLTQRVKNTAYQNMSLKQIATVIVQAYGLELDMAEDGPTYEYFPQRGISDFDALYIECRRIGYRMLSTGRTVTIKTRTAEAFVLDKNDNLGLTFSVAHSAQGSGSGGARSADPDERTSTGKRKMVVDPDTGVTSAAEIEATTGAAGENFVTGSDVPVVAPRTTGATDTADRVRKANEARVKGITASWAAPTTPEILTIDPDSALKIENISTEIDRMWVVDTITHALSSSGFSTSGALYSPLRNKYPQPEEAAGEATGAVLDPTGFIKPSNGVLTSAFRTARRPNHQGIDLAGAAGDDIWASAAGTVLFADNVCPPLTASDGCNGGYGNLVFIDHPDGYQTRYAHLSRATVSPGQTVKQGQKVGEEGNSGYSRGVHLHFEIRQNGEPLDPQRFFKV